MREKKKEREKEREIEEEKERERISQQAKQARLSLRNDPELRKHF